MLDARCSTLDARRSTLDINININININIDIKQRIRSGAIAFRATKRRSAEAIASAHFVSTRFDMRRRAAAIETGRVPQRRRTAPHSHDQARLG
ncbi:hypothetical protein WS71_09595 [Burkholderia mayonis]|uniref:Uncharacterized protein n=1 Tax=Burkholderia mayonis TaxID=1385591 RepID=A0A1B4FV28_9BURK|nr:hypothetical protein WS71_09595 [Burkholderia mayonis]